MTGFLLRDCLLTAEELMLQQEEDTLVRGVKDKVLIVRGHNLVSFQVDYLRIKSKHLNALWNIVII